MTLGLVVILVIPLILLVILLGFVTLNRYITYKERIALAQMGFSIEDLDHATARKHGNRGVLWGGVITAMSGLALLLGLATLGTGAWLLGGLLPLFVGLGMVLIYFMTLGSIPSNAQKEIPGQTSGGAPIQDMKPSLALDDVPKQETPFDPAAGEQRGRTRETRRD